MRVMEERTRSNLGFRMVAEGIFASLRKSAMVDRVVWIGNILCFYTFM